MRFKIGALDIQNPVFLAPMAGITDVPFRNIVSDFGAGLVVSEMVASHELVQAKPSTRMRAELGFADHNTSVQIAGRDAGLMAECARICAGEGARIIDINMGCPAKTVTKGATGSALMREPDLAVRLVEAVAEAVDIPVTVKMRLGWDHDSLNAADIALRAVNGGAQMITVHGRTRCQFYKGRADWAAIGAVVEAVDVPVIANGDIVDTQTAATALKVSSAAGVMVGRGTQGCPWVIADIAQALAGGDETGAPKLGDLVDLICRHYEAILSFYGTPLGMRNARKHLGWYLDRIDGAKPVRDRIFRAGTPDEVFALLNGLRDRRAAPAAVAA